MKIGTEVRYCDEKQAERRAQVSFVHESGEVDLSVYDLAGAIAFGVTKPPRATKPEHRISPGYWF